MRSVTRPPPPTSIAHACARTRLYPRTRGCTNTPRCGMHNEKDMQRYIHMQQISPSFPSPGRQTLAYTHIRARVYAQIHRHTLTHIHRGNPSPSFRPPQQPWHAVERGRRPHLENRRGLLLCFDGELTPKFCQNSTSPFFFSPPYHSALLRGFL